MAKMTTSGWLGTSQAYYELAASGAPFGIGSLSNQTVDLQKFENAQVFP